MVHGDVQVWTLLTHYSLSEADWSRGSKKRKHLSRFRWAFLLPADTETHTQRRFGMLTWQSKQGLHFCGRFSKSRLRRCHLRPFSWAQHPEGWQWRSQAQRVLIRDDSDDEYSSWQFSCRDWRSEARFWPRVRLATLRLQTPSWETGGWWAVTYVALSLLYFSAHLRVSSR